MGVLAHSLVGSSIGSPWLNFKLHRFLNKESKLFNTYTFLFHFPEVITKAMELSITKSYWYIQSYTSLIYDVRPGNYKYEITKSAYFNFLIVYWLKHIWELVYLSFSKENKKYLVIQLAHNLHQSKYNLIKKFKKSKVQWTCTAFKGGWN